MKRWTLRDFVRESNRIEGIPGITKCVLDAHETFLMGDPSIERLSAFVDAVQPGARLRDFPGRDVSIYSGGRKIYSAPRGGPEIRARLGELLDAMLAHRGSASAAYALHCDYETLHPFTDGNGRSGRALWLWMRGGIGQVPLGFLHHWYYDSLRAARR